MGVDIQTYRAKIGTFRHSCGIDVVTFVLVVNFSYGLKAVGSLLFIGVLLMMAGIEPNPGPTESGNTQSTKIKVTGIPKTADAEILTFFFENTKRKGGGTVKQVTVDNDRNSAIVEFEKAAAVDRVMKQQPIKILETEVNVEVYVDTITTRPTKIKVSGLPDSAKHEFLIMFFENERQGGGTVKSVTMYSDKHCAVIEFEEAEAVEFVLKNQPLLIRGKEVSLEAIIHETEDKLNSIKVSGLPEGAIGKACLQQYFENVDKGGGKVKEVYINKDECSAIIEFEEKNSVDIILKKLPITILDTEVVVKRFSDSTSFPCPIMPELQGILSQDSTHTTGTIQESVEDNFPKPEKAQIPEPSYPDDGIDEPKRRSVRDMVSDFSKVVLERSSSDQKLSLNPMDTVTKKGDDSSKSLVLVSQDGDHATGAAPHESVEAHLRSARILKPEKPPKPAKKPTKREHNFERPGSDHKYTDGERNTSEFVTMLDIDISSNSQQQKIKVTNDGNSESGPNLSFCSEVSELKCLGNRNDTTRTELTNCKSSPPVLKQVASVGSYPVTGAKETESVRLRKLLIKFGLEDKYPGKISIKDVISVDLNESNEQNKQQICAVELPWILLKRVICAHSESRDITRTENTTVEHSIDLDIGLSMLSEEPGDSQDSPLDTFTVVFQCCDPFMKQLFFQKLYLCKIAVPFLYNHLETDDLYLPLLSVWPLRSLVIANNTLSSTSEVKSKEVGVLELKTKVLAFARFGRPRYSKSKLLNSLLSNQGFKTFFDIDCPSGMTPRYLSKGQIDMFWLPTTGDKKDRFNDSMTFLNMRGSIKESFSVTTLSFVETFIDSIILIVDLQTVLLQPNEIKYVLLNFTSVILIIANPLQKDEIMSMKRFKSDMTALKPKMSLRVLSTHKGLIEQNIVDMTSGISKSIISQLEQYTTKSLEERLKCARNDQTKTDEDDRNCQQGKKVAETLVQQMKEDGQSSCWKKVLTPVHSIFSLQLGKLVKEHERERSFSECERINREMKTIRQKQTDRVTKSVSLFADILIRYKQSYFILNFFLNWLRIFIEIEKKQILPQLMYENRCAWTQLKTLKSRETQVSSDIEQQESNILQLEAKIDDASFSVEHFFREIGHIYEAILELNDLGLTSKLGLPPLEQMADIFGHLVADGHQFELIDGNSFYLPHKWTKSVLQNVGRYIGSCKVMTLSVLGLQSSGKSTLLNTMFGSQFPTKTGRCTRGIHIQLIPVKTRSFKENALPFNYVLVVDTEGLRSPELSHIQHEHDNELATVITGIGDITILNIMGENPNEIRDILQIIVHAFIRLKMTNRMLDIRKSCAFIHQNVADTSASENMMSGLNKLMQTLDEMTKESARSEGIHDITAFNQIIEFDINSTVWYLKNLWLGNPPMATVNSEYSERVVDIKCKIIQKAMQMTGKSFKSLNDILEQAHNLWKGVLNEDFVFSFKNSLEIKAYMEMEKVVQDKLWHLESFICEKLLNISQKKFAGCDQKYKLRSVADKLIKDLDEVLAEKKYNTEENIKTYFDTNKYKDITIQWKNSQQRRIDTLSLKLEQSIRDHIGKKLNQRSLEIFTVASQERHEEELRRRSMEVANKYKGQKLTKAQITLLFDEIWQLFINKIDTTNTAERNRKKMKDVFENWLENTFKNSHALLKKSLERSTYLKPIPDLAKLEGSFNFTEINHGDISIITWKQMLLEKFGIKDIFKNVTENVNQIFATTDEKIKQLCQVNDEITEMIVNNLMHELDISIHAILTGKTGFDFKTSFYVKIHVHVSRIVHPIFEQHNDMYFKTYGIAACLEQYRQQQEISFEAHLSNRQSEDIVAKLFSHVIEGFAEDYTSQNLPNKVTDELRNKLPSVKTVAIIKICSDLLAKASFKHFISYIRAPKEYVSFWVAVNANDYLFSTESRAYSRIANSLLNSIFNSVETCLDKIKSCYPKKQPPTMEMWLHDFHVSLKEANFSIPPENFRNVKMEVEQIKNVEYLTSEILAHMIASREKLCAKYSSYNRNSVSWSDTNPIERITKKIWGCPEQCAFCGEPCVKDEDHVGSVHYSIQHRPSCCNGTRHMETGVASLSACEFDIQSNYEHNCPAFNYACNKETRKDCDKYHPYTDYKTFLPEWYIPSSSNMHDTSQFWMWFVATYKQDLHEYYNYELDNHIPSSWKEITNDQAKESLLKTYST